MARRHVPEQRHYRSYRSCLRWEFGFCCAFCFRHEAELAKAGAEGTGLTTIEHLIGQAAVPDARDEYVNCVYCCRDCNIARGMLPRVDGRGRRLLDPTSQAWALHFNLERHEMLPVAGDVDAVYTAEAYDLGDPRKTRSRMERQTAIGEALRVVRAVPDLLDKLEGKVARDGDKDGTIRSAVFELVKVLRLSILQLRLFAPVPADATRCGCGADFAELPAYLVPQLVPWEPPLHSA